MQRFQNDHRVLAVLLAELARGHGGLRTAETELCFDEEAHEAVERRRVDQPVLQLDKVEHLGDQGRDRCAQQGRTLLERVAVVEDEALAQQERHLHAPQPHGAVVGRREDGVRLRTACDAGGQRPVEEVQGHDDELALVGLVRDHDQPVQLPVVDGRSQDRLTRALRLAVQVRQTLLRGRPENRLAQVPHAETQPLGVEAHLCAGVLLERSQGQGRRRRAVGGLRAVGEEAQARRGGRT